MKRCVLTIMFLALSAVAFTQVSTTVQPIHSGAGWLYRPTKPAVEPTPAGPLAPLAIELPDPSFCGTPIEYWSPNFETVFIPRPSFLAPEGTTLISRGRPVTCSDITIVPEKLEMVTDGDKRFDAESVLTLKPGLQFVQVDLEGRYTIQAIVVWHFHEYERVYKDVAVVISNEPEFNDALVLFNNDYDKSSGLGVGTDKEYIDKTEGKLIDAGGVTAQYIRLYSNGNTSDDGNTYIEVEVYGKTTE